MERLHSSSSLPIGIFDSGIGGLTVANAIMAHLPGESIVYYGDTAHVPYGHKPAETIRQFSLDITRFLLGRGCKAIVVACNTATAAALPLLRETWPGIPFVGMEPAVKPAALATRSGVVGVLATQGTFRSQRYASLMERFASQVTMLENPCTGLVELIENGHEQSPPTETLLQGILHPMLDRGADTLVLGCTHYPFVRPLIERITGPGTTIIDPAPAVARQLERLLRESALINLSGQPAEHQFFASGETGSLHTGLHRLGLQAHPVHNGSFLPL